MGKTKAALAGRAWRLLRLALFWARKGGLFKRRGMLQDLRLVMHQHIKRLRGGARSDAIHAGEREFSLDETPIFHFKMIHRPRSARMIHIIPCINPPVDFDNDDDDDDYYFHFDQHRRASCQRWGGDAYEAEDEEESAEDWDASEVLAIGGAGEEPAYEVSAGDHVRGDEEEEAKCVDMKADEFIAKIYAQMKLQRQISLLQYNEMLLRSTN